MLVVSSRYPCGERSPLSEVLSFWCIRKEITRKTGGNGLGKQEGTLSISKMLEKWSWKSFVSESYNGVAAHLLWTGTATSLRQEGRQRIRQAVKRKGASLLFGITKAKTVSLWTGCLGGMGKKKNQKPRWNIWQECVSINDLPDRKEAPMALLIRVQVPLPREGQTTCYSVSPLILTIWVPEDKSILLEMVSIHKIKP